MLVIHEFDVLCLIVEKSGWPPTEPQLRRSEWLARQLQLSLLQMIQIQVAVTAGPDEFRRHKVALLGQHVSEQMLKGTPRNTSALR